MATSRLGHAIIGGTEPRITRCKAANGRAEHKPRVALRVRLLGRVRRPARDYERLAATLKGLHLLAFAVITLRRFVAPMTAHA